MTDRDTSSAESAERRRTVPGELVHRSTSGHVATITLDSPRNRNALSEQLVSELREHLRLADESDVVRVIVLTHTGTTFCAGADLAEAVELGMERATRALLELLRGIAALGTPVMAVVRGHVRAGGLGLVGACDIAVVSTESTFAFTEVLLGLTPAIISLTTQSRLRERDAAVQFLTGQTFDGVEAARTGLVTAAVPEEDLDAEVGSMLTAFGKASPQGLRETKALLNRPLLARIGARGEDLVALSARLFASEQALEAITAYREHRPAPWAGD